MEREVLGVLIAIVVIATIVTVSFWVSKNINKN